MAQIQSTIFLKCENQRQVAISRVQQSVNARSTQFLVLFPVDSLSTSSQCDVLGKFYTLIVRRLLVFGNLLHHITFVASYRLGTNF